MKFRHILMLVAVVVATYLAFFADKTPETEVADAVPRGMQTANPARPNERADVSKINAPQQTPTTPPVSAKPVAKNGKTQIIYALQERATLISDGRKASSEESIFNSQSWNPPPPPAPKASELPRPSAPPLSFTYLGKMKQDGAWEVYLARGEKVFIVHADSVIEGVYQVTSILPPTLTLNYLPLKQMQQLSIGGNY